MAKKQSFTEAERKAYNAGKAAASKAPAKKAPAKKSAPAKKDAKDFTKRSGCKYEESYRSGDEIINRPRITGWRITSQGFFQSFTAYLDKNDGRPRNGTSADVCRVFVVNIETKGLGTSTETGVWSMKYKKLSITKLDLVANPDAPRGGYFGRGGKRYADKVK